MIFPYAAPGMSKNSSMFCLLKDRVFFIFVKYKKVTFTTECAHHIHEWLTLSKVTQKYLTLHTWSLTMK